jgi:UDP-N-acetylglucosamine 2-epimerase (non-hydrolysing)
MIHFVVGTKAQMVKIAPVMKQLQDIGTPYRFIFTGQHQETIDDLRANFGVKEPDVVLYRGTDIVSVPQMFFWVLRIVFKTLTQRSKIFEHDKKGIVLVHGDTFSTALGALMGKVAGLKVGHIESGLRSFNIFHPFPEELTRIFTFYLTDIYYCPGKWAVDNLKSFRGEKVDTQYNTLLDSLRHVRKDFDSAHIKIPAEKYFVISTHRFENLFRKKTFESNIDLIELATQKIRGIFIMHPVTKKKLIEFDLLSRLEKNPNIEIRPRYDYLNFLKLVENSEFLITDGGSNQEECFYMGKPCLLLRNATERMEGIDQNVVVSKYDEQTCINFYEGYKGMRIEPAFESKSPSSTISIHLQKFQN